jgi:hypothetical protein
VLGQTPAGEAEGGCCCVVALQTRTDLVPYVIIKMTKRLEDLTCHISLLIKPVFLINVYLVLLFNFVVTLLHRYKRKSDKFPQDSGNEILYLSEW